jgi:hypothetical protein
MRDNDRAPVRTLAGALRLVPAIVARDGRSEGRFIMLFPGAMICMWAGTNPGPFRAFHVLDVIVVPLLLLLAALAAVAIRRRTAAVSPDVVSAWRDASLKLFLKLTAYVAAIGAVSYVTFYLVYGNPLLELSLMHLVTSLAAGISISWFAAVIWSAIAKKALALGVE